MALEDTSFRRAKPLLFLAFLVLEGPKSRRELAELFWPDTTDPRDSLSTTIRRLRSAAEDVISTDGDRVHAHVSCDALELRQASRTRNHEKVLSLNSGTFLQGLDLPLSHEVEEWVFTTRERLTEHVQQAHLRTAEEALSQGHMARAGQHAEAALDVRQGDLFEHRDLIALCRVLNATGSARLRDARALAEELGVDLDDVSSAGDPISVNVRSASGRGVPSNLTPMETTFVGRRDELDVIAQTIADPNVRLLTIHGPGGIGKSRLAVRAAQEALDDGQYEEGVYLVQLETLTHAEQVPFALAATMSIQLLPHLSAGEQLAASIGSKQVLVILDNAEHLVPMKELLNELLTSCPNLMLLVTSRVRLDLTRESVLTLTGLPVHGSAEGVSDAVMLFEIRARRSNLDLVTSADTEASVMQLCELVAGFPLGIELAANWAHVLPPDQLALEVAENPDFLASIAHDAPARHQSLRGIVHYSWSLLSEDAQIALRRLAVFRGGFDRDAARAVTGTTLTELRELVDASLLRTSHAGRFDRHPLVFEVSLEKLEAAPTEAKQLRTAHARYFMNVLADLEDGMLGGPGLPSAAETLGIELANIREAWSHATSPDAYAMLPISSLVLVFYAEVLGQYEEVGAISQLVIDNLRPSTGDALSKAAWASATACKAYTRFRLGEPAEAEELGLAAIKSIQDTNSRAADIVTFIAGCATSNVSLVAGDYATAAERLGWVLQAAKRERERSQTPIEIKRGDLMRGIGHEIRGAVAVLCGEHDVAMTHLVQGERLLRKHQSPILCNILWHLGEVGNANGEYERAKSYLEDGLMLAQQMQYRTMQAYIGAELARTTFELGDPKKAEELSHQVLDLSRALQVKDLEVGAHMQLGRSFAARSQHRRSLSNYASALSSATTAKSSYQIVDVLLAVAKSLEAIGHTSEAVDVLTIVLQHPGTPQTTKSQAREDIRRMGQIGEVDTASTGKRHRFETMQELTEALSVFAGLQNNA